jgi:hypothetical protein
VAWRKFFIYFLCLRLESSQTRMKTKAQASRPSFFALAH